MMVLSINVVFCRQGRLRVFFGGGGKNVLCKASHDQELHVYFVAKYYIHNCTVTESQITRPKAYAIYENGTFALGASYT